MDCSKEYILMCGEAKKLQAKWDFTSEFNILFDKVLKKPFLNVTLYVQGVRKNKNRYIWLPLQHQLQELAGYEDCKECLDDFTYFIHTCRGYYGKTCSELVEINRRQSPKEIGEMPIDKFASMEQLWLAFVMRRRYLKIWTGEDWING